MLSKEGRRRRRTTELRGEERAGRPCCGEESGRRQSGKESKIIQGDGWRLGRRRASGVARRTPKCRGGTRWRGGGSDGGGVERVGIDRKRSKWLATAAETRVEVSVVEVVAMAGVAKVGGRWPRLVQRNGLVVNPSNAALHVRTSLSRRALA